MRNPVPLLDLASEEVKIELFRSVFGCRETILPLPAEPADGNGKEAAKRLLRKLLNTQGRMPRAVVTNGRSATSLPNAK